MNYSLTLATLGLFAAACTIQTSTPVEQPKLSSTVATNAIYPSTSAQSDGTNLTVYAALLSGKFLTLSGEDKLSVVVGDAPEQPLTLEPNSSSSPHYWLTVPSPQKQTNVTIRLTRAKGEVDAIALVVPAPFTLGTTPTSVDTRKQLELAVTPAPVAGESWLVYVDGPCTVGDVPLIATVQNGLLEIQPSSLLRPKNAASSCAVTVKVQHQLTGKADAAFNKPFSSDAIGVEERRFSAQFTW